MVSNLGDKIQGCRWGGGAQWGISINPGRTSLCDVTVLWDAVSEFAPQIPDNEALRKSHQAHNTRILFPVQAKQAHGVPHAGSPVGQRVLMEGPSMAARANGKKFIGLHIAENRETGW